MIAPGERRKIYAVLAAQLDLLDGLITGEALFERLWYFAEVLPGLARRLAPDSGMAAQIVQLDAELDALSLLQAQQLDMARQTLAMMRRALEFAARQPADGGLTPALLEQSYTTETQRRTHQEALAAMPPG
ncbi:hypothetical protein [Acidocella sp.]|uniref:hypothetical protein n=1 Tax=Acidocella sp. TaxID=50710 RepID=UPI002602BA5E|nr:hypothetical protein [Acidocella sp.]